MIFGLFLLNNTSVLAERAVVLNEDIDVIRGDDGEDVYYEAGPTSINIKVEDYSVTLVRWRWVNPEGMATPWSDHKDISKVGKNYAKFSVDQPYSEEYTEVADLSNRESAAKAITYWLDIEYYKTNSWFGKCNADPFLGVFGACELKDSESLRFVAADTANNVVINMEYNKKSKEVTVEAKALTKDNVGYGIITHISYMPSDKKLTLAQVSELMKDDANGAIDLINYEDGNDEYGNYFKKNISNIDTKDYSYVYVKVETFNSNGITYYDAISLADGQSVEGFIDNGDDNDKDKSNKGDEGGLFSGEYGFGEIVLIVVVIILIIGCALLVVQKVVDYKKRSSYQQ
jgi:hypothetical protein